MGWGVRSICVILSENPKGRKNSWKNVDIGERIKLKYKL